MSSFKSAVGFLREAVRIRARFPYLREVRVVEVLRRSPPVIGCKEDGSPLDDTEEIEVVYEIDDPFERDEGWVQSSLYLHVSPEGPRVLTHNDGLGLEFEAGHGGSGALGLWLLTLPLSALFPVWMLWHMANFADEWARGMTRYSRAVYKAFAPQLDDEIRSLLSQALRRHYRAYLADDPRR